MEYKYKEIETKSILGPGNNVNLYRGCTHNCIYCDARSECYNQNDNYRYNIFEEICVKKDAIKIFNEEINRKRKKGMIRTGSMCDPYIHLEKELCLTRQMLQIIKEKEFGVSILTKSTLLLRDIDLIEEINKKYHSLVCMTITTYDDDLCKKIERNVSVTSERFNCLKEFNKRGIPTGIWLCPILPFINDTVENIENIINKCVEVGVKYIIIFQFGTTKRLGSQDYFYKCLDKYFPGVKEKYIKYYGDEYDCVSPNAIILWNHFKSLCKKNNLVYGLCDVNKVFK